MSRGNRSRPNPPPIYAICDAEALAPGTVAEGFAVVVASGVRWIQVRAKGLSGGELYDQLARCAELAAGREITLWIDDRADLAALFPGVRGVHLGQDDLPPSRARGVVGDRWIGRSTHDEEQVATADRDPDVDLVAVGPVYPTTGKKRPDAVVGLDLVRRARAMTTKPIVAIGGIDAPRVAEVLAAGADTVAVLGGVCRGDVLDNCRRLLAAGEASAGRERRETS